jgi:uncharacterized protein (TIGR00162 family)
MLTLNTSLLRLAYEDIVTVNIQLLRTPALKRPTLICGLPGSGYVGKLAVDHMIKELKAELFAEIYSDAFPPHVLIKSDGIISLVKNELYSWVNSDSGEDIIIYTGDSQPITPEGDYQLGREVLQLCWNLGVRKVFTFGAYITGAFTGKPRVFVAATNPDTLTLLHSYGAQVTNDGTITGMNGLLLGLAKIMQMEGTSLLGETSGYIVDAKAAQIVLETFTQMVPIPLDLSKLEERAKETENVVKNIADAQRRGQEKGGDRSRLGYIT